MPEPQPTRSELQESTFSLPLVESGQEISEAAALAIIQDLDTSQSVLPIHIRHQALTIYNDLVEELEELPQHPDVVTIRRRELRGAIAKTALRAAAQTVNDIGQTTKRVKDFEDAFAVEGPPQNMPAEEFQTETIDDIDPDLASELNDLTYTDEAILAHLVALENTKPNLAAAIKLTATIETPNGKVLDLPTVARAFRLFQIIEIAVLAKKNQ
jgi:hypothetical protein